MARTAAALTLALALIAFAQVPARAQSLAVGPSADPGSLAVLLANATPEDLAALQQAGRREPVLAFALSFLLTGLGQGYNGQWGKGALMFAGGFVAVIVMVAGAYDCGAWGVVFVGADESCGLFAVGGIGAAGIWLWSVIDAPITASRLNRQRGGALLEIGPRLNVALSRRFNSDAFAVPVTLVPQARLSLARVQF